MHDGAYLQLTLREHDGGVQEVEGTGGAGEGSEDSEDDEDAAFGRRAGAWC